MVAKAGGYYGSELQGSRGVTQGDPLSPRIFNVVVDTLMRHGFAGMVDIADKWSGRGQEGRHQNSIFYTDDSIVASSDPRWIQGAFRTPVGLFNRVDLNNNVRKTAGIFCCPLQATGT